MAVVYLARDERLGRLVALKIIAPERAADEEFRKRFIRESRIAAAVDHPHIIPVFDAGDAGGLLYIATRYVPGGDVGTVVRREGSLSPGRAARAGIGRRGPGNAECPVQPRLLERGSGDAAAARDQLAVLLAVRERALGASHPDTLATRRQLTRWTSKAAGRAGIGEQKLAATRPVTSGRRWLFGWRPPIGSSLPLAQLPRPVPGWPIPRGRALQPSPSSTVLVAYVLVRSGWVGW